LLHFVVQLHHATNLPRLLSIIFHRLTIASQVWLEWLLVTDEIIISSALLIASLRHTMDVRKHRRSSWATDQSQLSDGEIG